MLSGITQPSVFTRSRTERSSGFVKVWKPTPSSPLRDRSSLTAGLNPLVFNTAILARGGIFHHSVRSGPDKLGGRCHPSHIGRLNSRLHAHWSELNWHVSAGSWWPATPTPNTWIGTRCWRRGDGNSILIMPTWTPVCSLERTSQPPTHTAPLFTMSWASWWRRISRW